MTGTREKLLLNRRTIFEALDEQPRTAQAIFMQMCGLSDGDRMTASLRRGRKLVGSILEQMWNEGTVNRRVVERRDSFPLIVFWV